MMTSEWWKQHPQELADGRKTNAFYEYQARLHFERYCEKIGVEAYEDVEFESCADLGMAVGTGGSRRVCIDFNTLRHYPDRIEEVVAHEVAHTFVARNGLGSGHGPAWCEKITEWGFPASRIAKGIYKNGEC